MTNTKTNQKGFTIIELVITIAIGAAVMALVLNAINGARRSQRNNARIADVGKVVTALNQYVSNRNKTPTKWDDIQAAIEPNELAQYEHGNKIFQASSWGTGIPAANGDFLKVQTASGGTGNNISCIAACQAQTTSKHADNLHPITTAGSNTLMDDSYEGRYDLMAVLTDAKCTQDNDAVIYGGLRRMVIVYRLEGQAGVTCRDI